MNARTPAGPAGGPADATRRSRPMALLTGLFLAEAALALTLAIFFSLLAAGLRDFIGGDAGRSAEETVRFAAGGAFIFAIAAAIAARGSYRRRPWTWTLGAVLQLIVAIGTAVAMLAAGWTPIYLLTFALATATMLVLSSAGVRRALGQE